MGLDFTDLGSFIRGQDIAKLKCRICQNQPMNTHNHHRFPPGLLSSFLATPAACFSQFIVEGCVASRPARDQTEHNTTGAFIEPPQNPWADNLLNLVQKGAAPGRKEIPITPDGPDVLDGGDVVESVGEVV
jgi:hypothetical protein